MDQHEQRQAHASVEWLASAGRRPLGGGFSSFRKPSSMSSARKLDEAQFFLELLDALDRRRCPLTRDADTASEASFLYAAILNSFYSAIAIMRDQEGIDVSAFVVAHPEIYARADKGGERAKTVHVHHTEPAFSGYIPPDAHAVDLNFRPTPRLVEESRQPGRADLHFGPDHYMHIERRGELVNVTDFCYEHFHELKRFRENHP